MPRFPGACGARAGRLIAAKANPMGRVSGQISSLPCRSSHAGAWPQGKSRHDADHGDDHGDDHGGVVLGCRCLTSMELNSILIRNSKAKQSRAKQSNSSHQRTMEQTIRRRERALQQHHQSMVNRIHQFIRVYGISSAACRNARGYRDTLEKKDF